MPKQLIYIAAGLLFVAMLPLPYGYYLLLRIIACGVFVSSAFITYNRDEKISPWVFIILAIVFNPIIKIHFQKEIWIAIDFLSGLFLIIYRDKIQANN